ncbi:N-hydroxyarylamine O-acetyltransferase [Nocardioides sp. Root1257]|uniref:arylamine N-acetyltransferase family protein n=1 Tax=unclassified Nocardioides TaxID=2615069 RepID=UPI0006F3CB83|nr:MULTISPECIES: arylamine N-acetyltransferase [unclassified Nocardioides]KQW53645.1 N-hydroxyarylamine O-acetyltransferase [Nocardioides sp. Root1257]KRC56331.1 N-hydroxyarylamine O-acetyltransferase [Nocardioides sp. Root224]
MPTDPWRTDELDLSGYLARLGTTAREPGAAALAELHEAHVRSFTFDNVDVLLGQHPGVSIDAVQEKFVGRGRGGYCFEHSTIFAAALERLGYDVRRHLGRVGDPAAGTQQGRTHMVVEVVVDGERLLCDPGFGMSLLRPVTLVDGAEDDYLPGWRYRVRRTTEGDWALDRLREGGWEVAHTTDELAVRPVDVVMGHHYTSTYPGSHFTTGLVLARHLPGRHVTVTHESVTVRTPGEPTVHRPLRDGEVDAWLTELAVPLTDDERARLLDRVARLP